MCERLYLGIDGGGTRTTALVATEDLQPVQRAEFGPGNLRLLDDDGLIKLFREISQLCPVPQAIGIGLAGLRDTKDETRVRSAVRQVWGELPMALSHDLRIALAAAPVPNDLSASILVLSGTGSCCYGENKLGRQAKVGGWGHLLGDRGSGYDIALRALREVIFELDRHKRWTELGRAILRTLLLNSPEELIAWAQSASKAQIASLARVVCEAEAKCDPIGRRILPELAKQLAEDAAICASRLAKPRERVAFILAGGVLRKQKSFARRLSVVLRANWPNCLVIANAEEAALGAAKLAVAAAQVADQRILSSLDPRTQSVSGTTSLERYVPRFVPEQSPTEMRNPKSKKLDRLSVRGAVSLMLDAEKDVSPALRREQRNIERAVEMSSHSLRAGGRIFYVGAGTSGRLGVLDASECPPTFSASPEMVQGIIAGGQHALWEAVEGAEDDWPAGAESIRMRGVAHKDTVIGIAASGRTPFVWGALAAAKRAGARTVLLCFNPALQIDRKYRPDLVIAPNLGPEILTGSTRLKCGTATKLVLNMISTIAMVRLGKVASNLMVDLNPSNIKLRDRAVRIVRELTRCSAERAEVALEQNGWVVKRALRSLGYA